MKYILLLFLTTATANASVDTFTKKIFDLTNPSGADQFSAAMNISTMTGYSVYCAVTGTLAFSSTLQASNQNDATTQTFTDISGTTASVTNAGIMYDVTISNAATVRLKIGTFTGTGTAKCYFTAKG